MTTIRRKVRSSSLPFRNARRTSIAPTAEKIAPEAPAETAGASFFALVVIVLLIGLLIYHTTQNILLPLVIGVIGEGVLAVLYFVKQSMFEGIIQKILNLFNMSSHFSNFTNSILDLTGVVYYLSFIGIMLFLTVQSIQKRRWN